MERGTEGGTEGGGDGGGGGGREGRAVRNTTRKQNRLLASSNPLETSAEHQPTRRRGRSLANQRPSTTNCHWLRESICARTARYLHSGFTRNRLAFTPSPLQRANSWVQDLCKHLSFPQTWHKQKRCFLHATQSTHFTMISFIVNINLLLYIRLHMGEHLGRRAKRRAPNLAPNGQVQQDTSIPNSRGKFVPKAVSAGAWLGQTTYFPRRVRCSP